MSIFADSKAGLANLDPKTGEPPEERLTRASALVEMHDTLTDNDDKGSENRGAVQEMVDFFPPFDQERMDSEGRPDGFNVNFGLGAAIKNEGLGAFVDIFTSPPRLMNMKLKPEVRELEAPTWADIMAEECTTMIRSSDLGLPRFLTLADIFTTHGVGIAFFEDKKSWRYYSTGLDEMKFPKESEAISSMIEVTTCEKTLALDELYRKIANAPEDAETHNGWNVEYVKMLITEAVSGREWKNKYRSYENVVEEIKQNQLYVQTVLPTVTLVYGWVREYNGKISLYAAPRRPKQRRGVRRREFPDEWAFKEPGVFDRADQCFQIFPYSVGHKNKIYTIRGLGYMIYEAAQADNVLRNKMMENARMSSSHVFSAETVDDAFDLEIIDLGPVVVLPPGLTKQDQPAAMNLERNMIAALKSNEEMLERHSGGLAATQYFKESSARRTKLETAASLEHFSKLNAFAISLFYGPWDKLLRELVRRAFEETQTDPVVKQEIEEMKQKCIERGVPEEMFNKIDHKSTHAYRVLGNGSRSSRLMIFDQVATMFSSLDPEGQDNFVYDFLVEYLGADKAERYKQRPGRRTEPQDVKIAMLENFALLEGDEVKTLPGENPLLHLDTHLDELEAGLTLVKNGDMTHGDWAATRLPLYRHVQEHLQNATVHKDLMPELKEHERRTQNLKGIIDNGIKQLEKEARESEEAAQAQAGQNGGEIDPDQKAVMAEEQKHAMDVRHKFEMLEAEIAAMGMKSQAEIAIEKQESMARIHRENAEAVAAMRRESLASV